MAALCLLASIAQAAPLTLIFAGDIMLDDGPGQTIAAGGDPLAPFAALLSAADYRIGNLECPVAVGGQPHARKVAIFRAKPNTLDVLRGRFDAVSLANNHSGDYGHAAFLETMQHLDAQGIAYFGGGKNLTAAHKPLWIEKNGLRIAVLGYNEFKPRSFEAGAHWPGVAWSEDEHVIADIGAAKAAGADLVIPFMHWGWEKESRPDERQRTLARKMIDAGAALVVGGHPHVTQGAEIYKGKPIVYSLGNFVFDGFDYSGAQRGWLLRLKLDKTGVQEWDTLAAQMDDNGTPHPVPGALTPCGKAGDTQLAQCRNP
ncbi:MAG: putative poly-gamma-glutamate biosynthesis enzyme [Proteobacteria bacterium]|nr:putative poly-gamma-glutamate biosynthesis enzyme [Pseudomonadota bacterium]